MTQSRGEAHAERSGVAAAALGAVFPGLGHGYIGRWWRAAAMVVPTLVLGVLVVMAVRTPSFELLGSSSRRASSAGYSSRILWLSCGESPL